jgi:predicted deacylase
MTEATKQSKSLIESTVDYEKDGAQFGSLKIPHSVHRSAYGHIAIPIAVFKNGDGPTVLLTGGVHGDEYEGPVALSKLGRRLDPNSVSGRIIIVPALNFPAFVSATRISPIDGINLNRTFPGKRDGTVTEMIADYVTNALLPMSDYLFDFHAGGSSLQYLPSMLSPYLGEDEASNKMKELIHAFGPKRIIYYDGERALSGEDRVISNYAKKNDVAFLCGEFGGGSTVNLDGLNEVERGIERFLKKAGAIKAPPASIATTREGPVDTESLVMDEPGLFAYANKAGFFEPGYRLGEEVSANGVAGYIYDNSNPWAAPEVVRFASGGLAVCIRTFAQVEPGDCLGHLARRF